MDLVKLSNKEKLEEFLISPNGKVVVVSISNTSKTYPEGTTLPLYTYNTTTKQQKVLKLDKEALSLYNAKISEDEKYMVSFVGWNKPYLWDLETGTMLCKLLKPDTYDTASNTAISTQSNIIVTCAGTGGIDVWGLKERTMLQHIPGTSLTDIFLTAKGDLVIGRGQLDNTFHCWNVHTGQKITSLSTDGQSNIQNLVGDSLVLAVGENPNLMVMNLHIPGKDTSKDQQPPAIYDGLPVEVTLEDKSGPPTEKDSMDKDKVEGGQFLN